MQLGSAVSGVQHHLRCQSEAAATKPQRKVWAESGRSEDQNGACACTNAVSHMHKRSIYTKIPAVHTVMVVCPTSQHHLQENCRRGFCCFLSGALADGRDMDTSLLVLGLFRNNTLIHFNVAICSSSENKMDNVAYVWTYILISDQCLWSAEKRRNGSASCWEILNCSLIIMKDFVCYSLTLS